MKVNFQPTVNLASTILFLKNEYNLSVSIDLDSMIMQLSIIYIIERPMNISERS